MKTLTFAALTILVCSVGAMARDRVHPVRHPSSRGGTPIIAGNGDIRINAVGEVLSSPPPPLPSTAQNSPSAGAKATPVKP